MKKNQDTYLYGNKVVLIPYKKEHVPKYHHWMQSEELQQLTASEPLTMEEEYQMQKSWREDENKCTFIILDAEVYARTQDEITSMVGDVNLFFNEEEDPGSAEIEIMIAEAASRGKGFGKEALLAMMFYGMDALSVTGYTAKIGMANSASLYMFKKIGFTEISRSDVFQEVTLHLLLESSVSDWLRKNNVHLKIACNQNNQ